MNYWETTEKALKKRPKDTTSKYQLGVTDGRTYQFELDKAAHEKDVKEAVINAIDATEIQQDKDLAEKGKQLKVAFLKYIDDNLSIKKGRTGCGTCGFSIEDISKLINKYLSDDAPNDKTFNDKLDLMRKNLSIKTTCNCPKDIYGNHRDEVLK